MDEGDKIISHFKNHLKDLGKKNQNDTTENDNSMLTIGLLKLSCSVY